MANRCDPEGFRRTAREAAKSHRGGWSLVLLLLPALESQEAVCSTRHPASSTREADVDTQLLIVVSAPGLFPSFETIDELSSVFCWWALDRRTCRAGRFGYCFVNVSPFFVIFSFNCYLVRELSVGIRIR